MKSTEVVTAGYYWYLSGYGDTDEIIEAVIDQSQSVDFYFCGSEERFSAQELDRELIGPIAQPVLA